MIETKGAQSIMRTGAADADPALIVLPGAADPQVRQDESENDRRHRALAEAGFRSHAESMLLAQADELRERSFARTLFSDAEAEAAFDREAALSRRRALEAARGRFGKVDREAEAATSQSLVAMSERLKRGGVDRRRHALAQASIGTLREEAADIVQQVLKDPDRHAAYRPLLDRALARFGAIEPEQRAALASEFARDIDEAQVSGLIAEGRMDDAHQVLQAASARLGTPLVAEIEARIGAAAKAQARELATGQALAAADLSVRLAAGEPVGRHLEEAENTGAISPPQARRLRQLQTERSAREAQVDASIQRASSALGEGVPLDARSIDDRAAAELYWSRVIVPAFGKRGGAVGPQVTALVCELGIVPEALRQAIGLGLTDKNPEAVADAARLVAGLIAGNESFAERFAPSELAYVNLVSQAIYGGADPERAVAFAQSRMTFPEIAPPEAVRPDDLTGSVAGLLQNEAAGAFASHVAGGIEPSGLASLGMPFAKAVAGDIDGYFSALWHDGTWGTKSAVEATMLRRLQHPILGPLSLDPEGVRRRMQDDALKAFLGENADLQGSP